MRQVFSSPRLDNVEGVAKMLEDEGIEVRITQGRSYKGSWQGRRTYRETARDEPLPAVWVVKSEDQPRARQLLRDAGLLATTRAASDSYLSPSVHAEAGLRPPATPQRRAFRYKMMLLGAIALALVLTFTTARKPRPATPAATAPTPAVPARAPAPARGTSAPQAPAVYRVDTPPALAELLVATEAQALGAKTVCASVDGQPAPAALAAALQGRGLQVADAAACSGATPPPTVAIADYVTDGSGTGTVRLRIASTGPDGRPREAARTLEVQREGLQWRVLRVVEAG